MYIMLNDVSGRNFYNIRDQQHVGLLSQFMLNSKHPCQYLNQVGFYASTQYPMRKDTAFLAHPDL